MHERHPVEKSPPYHVVIWIIAGIVAVAVVYGLVKRANVPPLPAPIPARESPEGKAAGNPQQPAVLPRIPFTDITSQAGITFTHEGGATGEKMLPESGGAGCAFLDYDNDGDPDLLLINGKSWEWNATTVTAPAKNVLALYRNDGDGKFADVTAAAGLSGDFYGQGAAIGDYDADGDDDIVVTALAGIHLYRNDGGKFSKVAADSGLQVGATDWPTSAGFLDYDRDGDLDLFVCNYVRWTREADKAAVRRVPGTSLSYAHPENFDGVQNFLFRNDGGRFTDVSAAAGIRINDPATNKPLAKALAATFLDFDDDGWLDIFVSNDTVRHLLYRNRGDGSFEEVGTARGSALNASGATTSGMSADAAWLRGDEGLAIGIGNFAEERTTLFVADGEKAARRFVDQSIEAGIGAPTRDMLTWGLLFDDFDLDGRTDLAQANGHLEETITAVRPNQTYAQRGKLFWNHGGDGPRLFTDLPAENIGDLAKPAVGRGLASADIDADGDLDLTMTTVGGQPRLLRNDRETSGHWLRVRLVGPAGNPRGIGAMIELRAAGRSQRRTIMPTRSYLSQTEPVATFGLGDALLIESLVVTWPDGTQQTVVVDGVDRMLTVHYDRQTFAVLANIGKAQLENAEYQRAITTFQRALAMKPDSVATRRNIARARFLWGQFANALDELGKLDAESPSAATAYIMGLAAMRLANQQKLPYAEPVAHLRRAVSLDPNDATLRYQLGIALSDAGEADAADEQFRRTVELDPLHGQAQYRLALRTRRSDPELSGRYMRDYQRVLALKGGKIEPSSLEICRYTKAESPEADNPAQPAEVAAAIRLTAVERTASGDNAPTNLVAVAPLLLSPGGHYELAGVTSSGELLLIAFDDAGRAVVKQRGSLRLGEIGESAMLLVGNAFRELPPAPRPTDQNPAQAAAATPGPPADHPEFVVVTPTRTWFLRYSPDDGFVDLTENSGLSAAAGTVARWIDLEHDGDIDLCVGSPSGLKVWRNNSDGSFIEATSEFGLADAGPTVDLAAIDLEGWNLHTGLVVVGPEQASVWRSRIAGQFSRDTFADEARRLQPPPVRVIVNDFTNDAVADVLLISPGARITLNGASQDVPNLERIDEVAAIDIDNDGWLDLALFGRSSGQSRALVLQNRGGRFSDPPQPLDTPASPKAGGVLALDAEGDCHTDLLLLDGQGRLHTLRNETAAENRQLKLSLYSNVGHPSSIGTRVQVRRDNFIVTRWTSTELPIEIGVGPRTRVDSVQTLWANGIARNQISVDADCRPLFITILEFVATDSCPFLYAWIDGQWQFLNDLLGVAPLNVALARGVEMPPDPDELVVLGPAGRFANGENLARLRVSTELREVTFLDELRLLAVDHPADVSIFSRDRVAMTAIDGKQIIAGRNPIAPRRANGDDGIDRTSAVARLDGQFAEVGRVIPPPVVGFIEPLVIEFEFDDLPESKDLFLALSGWLRFGSSSNNIAASQRPGLQVIWPKLEVQRSDGEWQLVDDAIGLPAGKTKTIVCDLSGKLPPGARKFRLTSTFEVRWDCLAIYEKVPADQLSISEAGASHAELGWQGFAEQSTPGPAHFSVPDPSRRSDSPRWFTAIEGWCTRYGDILPLVSSADRQLAIISSGDAATIDFPAVNMPALTAGNTRSLLLYSRGWVKAGDPNGTGDLTVAPFPGSDGPSAGDDWQLKYNTRWVPRDRFAPILPSP